jgi:hypothetical protein
MPKRRTTVELNRDELLRESERQGTSLSMPLAIYHRLHLLSDLAAGANASRAEIIGMLIAKAELDPAQLEQGLLAYRHMTVDDVVPDQTSKEDVAPGHGNVVSIERRSPGRPAGSNRGTRRS